MKTGISAAIDAWALKREPDFCIPVYVHTEKNKTFAECWGTNPTRYNHSGAVDRLEWARADPWRRDKIKPHAIVRVYLK